MGKFRERSPLSNKTFVIIEKKPEQAKSVTESVYKSNKKTTARQSNNCLAVNISYNPDQLSAGLQLADVTSLFGTRR